MDIRFFSTLHRISITAAGNRDSEPMISNCSRQNQRKNEANSK
jgi:hypothetical protein